MKKLIAYTLVFITLTFNYSNIYAVTDSKVFIDPVNKTYVGTKEAKATISNIKFNDIPTGHWAKEAITKAGALNMVKGYNKNYNPSQKVSNQEALAFLLRVAGLEQEAQTLGESLKSNGFGESPLEIWSLGYLALARNLQLITNEQYNTATVKDESDLQDGDFKRTGPATREQVATWVTKILNYIMPIPLNVTNQQAIYGFSDWQDIASENINNVEIAVSNGIMKGSGGKFKPKGSLTRAEMAQLLTNLDSIYNDIKGLEKKNGTIAGIKDEQSNQTNNSNLTRSFYIRTSDGKIDVIKYELTANTSPQAYDKDVVVYNNGAVTGLASLREGNQIEYLVKNSDDSAIYINVLNSKLNKEPVFGVLKSIDYLNGKVEIQDSKGKRYSYYAVDGIIGTNASSNFAYINKIKKPEKEVPIGSNVNLILNNDVVTEISYVGGHNLVSEVNGVVTENNKEFSYITIVDSKGKEITKNYYADDISVEKQEHFDSDDEIGYIDQMFPNFKYDPRDTTIDKIEPGDIVFIRTKIDDKNVIDSISAVTNYSMKYGKINQISNDGLMVKMLIEYENGLTSWFEFDSDIFISKDGKPVNANSLSTGDWVRLLVNQATISPGETLETVKEIVVEEQGHLIGDIIKGKVGTINNIQNKMSIQDAYTLTKDGWSDHKDILQLSIANKDIQYYYQNKKVSLDYFDKYLKRANGEVYIALENNYAGNVISKITFRSGRDELLDPDVITTANGSDTLSTLAYASNIKADEGTIVRKEGRLINPSSIKSSDFAIISLNGSGNAAVIDIYETPAISSVLIARGRVSKIKENKSFTISSISQLTGNNWVYSPIERTFSIDPNTLFISQNGIKDISEFISYSENSSLDKVFTIIYNGTKATHIIEAPHPTKVVAGDIYDLADNKVKLKSGAYLNSKGAWESVSNKNTEIGVDTEQNTIVIKNNKVTDITSLKNGDKVRVFTEALPGKVTGGMTVSGRIIFVDN